MADGEALARARADGVAAAKATIEATAPDDPVLRVAWTAGFGAEPDLHTAVAAAREAGATWATIAQALDQNMRTVMTKFGTGYQRQAEYRARKRGEA